jgi:hypothetical protein
MVGNQETKKFALGGPSRAGNFDLNRRGVASRQGDDR